MSREDEHMQKEIWKFTIDILSQHLADVVDFMYQLKEKNFTLDEIIEAVDKDIQRRISYLKEQHLK